MTQESRKERARTEHMAQLGGLLAGFAHEIRNPLSTIGLNLQLVKEDYADAETSRGRRTHKRLTVVESEVKRLQAIVEEFLGFVRTPLPKRRMVDVNTLLQGLVELSEPELREAGVTLKFFPSPATGPAEIDPDQIRAVVVNLLRNAGEACEEGDEVLVSTRRKGDQVIVQVTDTGAGMELEVTERAFQPYYSTKKGGTGLGLALARRIAEEHDGSLELSSDVGKGTQLTLRLPGASADQAAEEA